MGFSSAWHWIIVLLVILIVFGAGKLPNVMGDVAKGIKSFKAGLKDQDEPTTVTTPTTTTNNNDGKVV
ncbi:MAG: twin-arginine translocase TatA/TatE family subunit [Geminicoccaceae bacterium]